MLVGIIVIVVSLCCHILFGWSFWLLIVSIIVGVGISLLIDKGFGLPIVTAIVGFALISSYQIAEKEWQFTNSLRTLIGQKVHRKIKNATPPGETVAEMIMKLQQEKENAAANEIEKLYKSGKSTEEILEYYQKVKNEGEKVRDAISDNQSINSDLKKSRSVSSQSEKISSDPIPAKLDVNASSSAPSPTSIEEPKKEEIKLDSKVDASSSLPVSSRNNSLPLAYEQKQNVGNLHVNATPQKKENLQLNRIVNVALDSYDNTQIQNAFEKSRSGTLYTWINTNSGMKYEIVPRSAIYHGKTPCRQAKLRSIYKNEQSQEKTLDACRKDNGYWVMQNM